ncbi:catabolite control protein A [Bombilactobacillus thymidiniphilus]|uniref:Catabolite control protein A n=1 Tax=Bombilactobacillus thymidiniphilus TaxID=2923363 RepID=A0ABY4PDU7_9LACO|nr:catabolite control protein A [Bombilactobacillus thymidiniphilus]UQS83882.1 catabolite control protein A [Bombilactobacillus thymidiniphilus]
MDQPEKEITITDVAKQAGVSMATVSRVVNGNNNVKEITRQKVLAVIDKLHYRPNAVARGLASKKSTTIGVIMPSITELLYANLADGIDDVASMYKYNILLTSFDNGKNEEQQLFNSLLAKQVDGIIYMGEQVSDELYESMLNSRVPVVFAGAVDHKNQIASVNIDYVTAARDVVKLLIDNGNQKIAMVTGDLKNSINGDYRLKGYQQALEQGGINYSSNNVFETVYNLQAGAAVWDAINDSGATAAYVTNDLLAAGIVNAAMAAGKNIPQDFEIITSSNTILCDVTRPQMTSVAQPLYDIGAVAMRMLTKLMNKEIVDELEVRLPYSLVKRDTTKKNN